MYEFTFCILGLSSIIGWNAVLSSMYYFAKQYDNSVFNLYNVPFQIGNMLFAILMPCIAKKITPLNRISYGLILVCIFLAIMMVFAELQKNLLGYSVTIVITFIIGSLNSIIQNSMVALAGQASQKLNGLYWIFTGFSGLLMSFMALILNFAFTGVEGQEFYSTMVFFLTAYIFSALAIYLSVQYQKENPLNQSQPSQQQQNLQPLMANDQNNNNNQNQDQNVQGQQIEFTNVFRQASMNKSEKSVNLQDESDEDSEQDIRQILGSYDHLDPKEKEEIKKQNKLKRRRSSLSFVQGVKLATQYARFIPLFIGIIYITTFALFPGVMISDVIFKSEFLSQNNQIMGTLLLNFCFSVFDVLGKATATFEIFHKTKLMYCLVILRFIFIGSGLLVARHTGGEFFNNDKFPFINMGLFSYTNGLTTGALMSIAPKKAKGNNKAIEQISFLNTFALLTGITIGSVLGIPLTGTPREVTE